MENAKKIIDALGAVSTHLATVKASWSVALNATLLSALEGKTAILAKGDALDAQIASARSTVAAASGVTAEPVEIPTVTVNEFHIREYEQGLVYDGAGNALDPNLAAFDTAKLHRLLAERFSDSAKEVMGAAQAIVALFRAGAPAWSPELVAAVRDTVQPLLPKIQELVALWGRVYGYHMSESDKHFNAFNV